MVAAAVPTAGGRSRAGVARSAARSALSRPRLRPMSSNVASEQPTQPGPASERPAAISKLLRKVARRGHPRAVTRTADDAGLPRSAAAPAPAATPRPFSPDPASRTEGAPQTVAASDAGGEPSGAAAPAELSCVIYATPWDTFVVRRERLLSGVWASCDPVVRLSPRPWGWVLGLAVWRVLWAKPRVACGTVSKLGMSLRRFAQAVDHASRVEVLVVGDVARLTPCQRNAAGLFTPVPARTVEVSATPLTLGRSILAVLAEGGGGTALPAPSSPAVATFKVPDDATLLLMRGVSPEDVVESMGVVLTPRKSRHVTRQQRDFARRLSLGHHDGWLVATPVECVDAGDETLIPLLEHLSRNGTAMYLASHTPAGYYAWALATEGRIERAFGVDVTTAEVFVDLGQPWQFEPDTSDVSQLSAESVRQMAREWAMDPWSVSFERIEPLSLVRRAA